MGTVVPRWITSPSRGGHGAFGAAAFVSTEACPSGRAFFVCAEHVRQLEGESPFDNLMEVKS